MSLPPTPDWLQSVLASGFDTVESVVTDSIGNAYICGYTDSTSVAIGGTVYNVPTTTVTEASYIVKLNSSGAVQWLRWIDGNSTGIGGVISYKITVDSTGNNIYLVGTTEVTPIIIYNEALASMVTYTNSATGAGTSAGFLFKIDSTGAPQWFRFFDSANNVEELFSVIVDPTGNVCVCSRGTGASTVNPLRIVDGAGVFTTLSFNGPSAGISKSFVAELTSSGAFQWLRWIDGLSSDIANEVVTDSSGNLYITGNSASQTVNIYDGPTTTIIPPTPAIIVTYTNPTPPTTDDSAFLLKLGSTGAPQWFRFFDGSLTENGISASTYTGFVYLTGRSDSTALAIANGAGAGSILSTHTNPASSNDAAFVVKLDTTGALQWLRWIDGSNTEEPYEITTDSLGNVYVTGISDSAAVTVYTGPSTPATPSSLVSYPSPNASPGIDQASFTIKFDSLGAPQWVVWIEGIGSQIGTGINVNSNGSIYITGISNKPSIFVYNSSLSLLASYTVPDTNVWGFVLKLLQLAPLNPICYAKGTLIGTDRGFVCIEDIMLSDKIRTYGRIEEKMFRPVHGIPFKALLRVGDTRSKNRFSNIKFIGHFSTEAISEHTAPICITAGALGENKPERDLFVSPNHSILIGDRMVFAKDMVNEISIYQDMSFETIEYYHILSDDHYIINANGVLSETLGTEELKLFETMIYAQSSVYKPLASENKFHLQNIEMIAN
jgi:hypothetical protein